MASRILAAVRRGELARNVHGREAPPFAASLLGRLIGRVFGRVGERPARSRPFFETLEQRLLPAGDLPAASAVVEVVDHTPAIFEQAERWTSTLDAAPPLFWNLANSGADRPASSTLDRLAFLPNLGQSAAGVDFNATGENYDLALAAREWVLTLASTAGATATVRMDLVGADPAAPGLGVSPLGGVTHFAFGDPSDWITAVPSFERVHYDDVYAGIDLEYYGRDSALEYDWLVGPGADPGAIRLEFSGIDGLTLSEAGDLLVHTAAGDFIQHAPVLYQEIDGERIAVSGGYLVTDGYTVTFDIGPYDTSRALTIDPVLGYSTYLGGTGKESIADVATDGVGNTYVVGTTESPSIAGRTTGASSALSRAFLTKYNAVGEIEYTTLFGATTKIDATGYAYSTGLALAIGPDGSPYVVFETVEGKTMPMSAGGFYPLNAPHILHVAKLGVDGLPAFDKDQLSFHTAALGNFQFFSSVGATEIAVDRTGAAYVTFGAAHQTAGLVHFVSKVSAAGSLEFARELFVLPSDIAVDGEGNLYLVATTTERDLPVSTNAVQAQKTAGDRDDLYVAKLDPTASALLAATYLGGADYDMAGGIALSPQTPGAVYLSGATASLDYPAKSPLPGHNPGRATPGDLPWDGFVTLLDLSKMEIVASALLGGSATDVLSDVTVDRSGRVYVAGETNSRDFSVTSPLQAEARSAAAIPNVGAPYDFVVAELDAMLSKIEFASYFGGGGHDSASAARPDIAGTYGGPRIAVGIDGTMHIAGVSSSTDFPTFAAAQAGYGGQRDAALLAIQQRSVVIGRSAIVEEDRAFSGVVADFTSARSNALPEDFDVTIDWGDGETPSGGTVTRSDPSSLEFRVLGTHEYKQRGAYAVRVEVKDKKTALDPQTNVNTAGFVGTQFEPTIAVDPTNPNRLFAAAVDETGLKNVAAGTGGGLFVSTSSDGGRTWSPRRIAVEAAGVPLPAALGDPKAVFDEFGNLFLTYLGAGRNSIVLAVSKDGGTTFRTVANLSPEGSAPGPGPLRVDQPSVAVGVGSVWVTYQDTFRDGVVAAGAIVTGLDQVGTMSSYLIPNAHGGFGDVSIGPHGEVLVLWQTDNTAGPPPFSVFTAVDPDGLGAAPFGEPRLLARTFTLGTALPFMPTQGVDSEFNFAWDRSFGDAGRVYVAYTEPTIPPGDPGDLTDLDIYLRYSDDAGATWQDPIKVSDAPVATFQFLPSIALDPRTGNVAVGWYDTRDDPNRIAAHYRVAVSNDHGATFQHSQRVSVAPSNATVVTGAVGRPKGFGDYSMMGFIDGVLHPVWADNSALLLGIPDRPIFDVATAAIGVIEVRPAPPAIQPLPIEVRKDQLYDGLVASFTVPSSTAKATDYEATIRWGDGESSKGEITQPGGPGTDFVVSGKHTYREAGAFPLLIEVKDLRSGVTTLPVSNVSRQQGSQAETTLAIDPTNPNRAFASYVEVSGLIPRGIAVAVSNDAGVTWQRRIVADGSDALPRGRGDPKAVFDRFGNLFVTYLTNTEPRGIAVLLSTDGGATFRSIGTFSDLQGADQPSIAVGPGENGEGDSVWLTWERGADPFQTIIAAGAPVFGLGQVGAFAQHLVAPLSPDGQYRNFGDIAIGPRGQVLLSYGKGSGANASGPSEIAMHVDPDGLGPAPFGAAIQPTIPSNVGASVSIPAQAVRTIDNEGNLAWDLSDGPHRGRLYLAYTDAPGAATAGELKDTDVFLRYSDDSGVHWSAPTRVHAADTNTQFLPSIAVDRATGNVAVGWYSATAGNIRTEFRTALSDDGGATFRAAYTVSPGLSDATAPTLDDRGLVFQYGDYTGIAFSKGVIQPIWTDNSAALGGNPDRRFEIASARVAVAEVLPEPLAVQAVAVAGVEGKRLAVPVARFTDPGGALDAASFRARIDWGDGAQSDGTIVRGNDGTFTVNGEHEYKAFGRYPVGVSIKGPRTAGDATATAEIENAKLTLETKSLRVVRESEFTKVVATLVDENHNSVAGDFIVTIEWGDGSASVATLALAAGSGANGAPNAFEISGKHKYLSEDTFSINVSLLERSSGQVLAKRGELTSADPPLVVNPGNFLDIEALPGIDTGDLVLAIFEPADDVDVALQTTIGEYTATIHWGDGTVETDIVPFMTSEDVTVTGRHRYLFPGRYFPQVSVQDDSGGLYFVNLVANVEPDVSTQVRAESSGLVYNPAGDLYVGEVRITNIGSVDLAGPFFVVFQGIPDGVTLVNVETLNGDGDPVVKVDQSRLLSGDSLEPIPLLFSNPDGVPITYTVRVFDGIGEDPLVGGGLLFEPNRGQASGDVSYVARGADYAIGLAADHAAVVLSGSAADAGAGALMEWVDADAAAAIVPLDPLTGVSNYLSGDGGINGVPHYGRVRYASVYDGIDLEYYGRDGRLEYDWILAAGADASAIGMRFHGVESISTDSAGNLVLRTPSGELLQRAPVAYQVIGGERRSVAASFTLRPDGSYGFSLGDYDSAAPLVIDPVLVYSTYLGGSGVAFFGADSVEAVAVDEQGNTYVTGRTVSPDFPTLNAFDDDLDEPETRIFQTTYDAFVTKFDASGAAVFSTYLGGGTNDTLTPFGTVGRSIAVDAGGRVFVGGGTDSPLFPVRNASPLPPSSFPFPFDDGGAFLVELSASGSELLYSTFMKGYSDIDDLALDAAGAVYAALSSVSPIAFKLDPQQNSLEWLRVFQFGGGASGIAVDALGQAYIVGTTVGTDFKPKNALFPTLPPAPVFPEDTRHAFAAKLSASGEVLFATLLGGSNRDFGADIALDASGVIYVGGSSESPDLPVPGGFDTSLDGARDGFVLALANDGRELLYGTYVGGSKDDSLVGIGVDAEGRIYLAGTTQSPDLPTLRAIKPELAPQDFDSTTDGFAGALRADRAGFEFLTYLGGTGTDSANGLAVDADGNVVVVGRTDSPQFPLREAFQNRPFFDDGFVVRFAPGNAGTIALANAAIRAIEGAPFDGLVASFTTTGMETADEFTATIDWGDGTASAGTIAGEWRTGFQVFGRHLYSEIGERDVFVTLRDSLGRPVTALHTDPVVGVDAARYHVSIDTSSLAGVAGVLGLQFNPGAIPGAPDAHAHIRDLAVVGGTAGAFALQGGATAGAAGEVDLGATAALNRALANVTLGSVIEFDLELSGPGIAAPANGLFSDMFALQLFGADGTTPLLASDATGSVLRVEVGPNGGTEARPANPAVTAGALGHATVANAPLHVDLVPFTVQEGLAPDVVVATFTSGNPLETAEEFAATIDWGDGSAPTAGRVAFDGARFTVSGAHAYLRAGVYPFGVTVAEPDGATTVAASSTVVNPVQAALATSMNVGLQFGQYMLSADLNGDGKLDAIAGKQSPGLVVRLGDGNFGFGPTISVAATNAAPTTGEGVVAADFDRDGILDLAIAGARVEVLLGNGDGTFRAGPVGPQATGPSPTGLAAGDFDGDGRVDLALGYGLSTQVSTFRGNGDGTFQPAGDALAVPFGNNFPFAADLDRDGRADIVVRVNGSATASVFLGRADGGFTSRTVNLGTGASALAIGDATGDSIADLVVGGTDLVILPGDGAGGFNASIRVAAPVRPQQLAIGDLDRDGLLDIVVADSTAESNGFGSSVQVGRIVVLRGQPGGGYAISEPLVGTMPTLRGLADWNSDGRLDLAAATAAGLLLYPGRGDGTLQAAREQLADLNARTVLTLDVNGDGFADIVTGGASGITVSLGSASGAFEEPAAVGVGANAFTVATADVNGDGRPDLVGGTSAGVAVSLQLPGGAYAPPVVYGLANAREVAVGDVNGDGRPDLVAATASVNTVTVLLNAGGGSFVFGPSFTPGVGPSSLLLRDFDGDGKLDLATTLTGTFDSVARVFVNAGVAVARGNGDGTFGAATSFAAGATFSSLTQKRVAAGDFDNDGKLDLAVAANGNQFGQGGLFVLLGNGDATFRSGPSLLPGLLTSPAVTAVAVADFNRDGKLDLAVTQNSGGVDRHEDVLLFAGVGDGTFRAPQALEGAVTAGEIAAGDLNGDGSPDLVVSESGFQTVRSGLNVLLGNGDGTFAPRASYAPGGSLGIALRDMNGDGTLDVALADYENSLFAVVDGHGDGTLAAALLTRPFELASSIKTGAVFALAPADVNHDGRVDLAATYGYLANAVVDLGGGDIRAAGADEVGVLLGNGDGTFQVRPAVLVPNYGLQTVGPNAWDIAVGDVNGDGQAEFVAGLRAPKRIVTIPLQADGTLGVPKDQTTAGGNISGGVYAIGDFNGDGRTDVAEVTRFGLPDQATLRVFRGQPNLTFVAGPSYAVGTKYSTNVPSLALEALAGDFNGDGRLDFALAQGIFDGGVVRGSLTVALGNGDGSFAAPVLYAQGTFLSALAAGDIDGDRDLDLVAVEGLAFRSVIVLSNNGSGGFTASRTYDVNSHSPLTFADLATGDFARDGAADIVVSSYGDRRLRILDVVPALGATVTNGILAVTGATLNPAPGVAFTAVVARLTDTNPLATAAEYTASIDWGDGSSSAGSVAADGQGGFRVTGSHTYATTGAKTITVRVNDDEGASAAGTGTADVAAAAAIGASPVTFNAIEDAPFEGTVATFTDADPNGSANDFAALIAWGDGETSTGTVVATGPGAFRVVGRHTYANPGTFNVPVTISDIAGNGASTVSTGAVAPHVNAAPTARADAYTAREDTALVVDAVQGVLANDTDPDRDTLTAVLVSGPAHGTVTLGANGSFNYLPPPDFFGADSFTYRAADATTASDIAVVSVAVRPANDAPRPAADAAATDEDTPVTIDVLANDVDVDGIIDRTSVVFGRFPLHGTVSTDSVTGAIRYTPAPDYFGSDSLAYRVRDLVGALAEEALVTIVVRPVNDGPVTRGEMYIVAEDTPFTAVAGQGVLANDLDPDGDALSATLVAGPAHGSLILNSDGGFVYVPAPEFSGSDAFRYRASDGAAQSSVTVVSLLVQPASDPPAVAPLPDQRIVEGTVLTLGGIFADPDDDDAWTAAIDYGDGSGVVPLALSGKAFTLDHQYVESGEYFATATVFDAGGASGSATVRIVVENLPPVVSAGPDRAGTEGVAIQLAATFADPGAADTHVAAVDWGDGGGFQSYPLVEQGGAGTVFASHAYADEGSYVVTVRVTDDEGAAGTDTFTVTVTNAAPEVDGGPDRIVDEGELVTLPALLPFDPGEPALGAAIQRSSGSFADRGGFDRHASTVDWGDGTVEGAPVFELPFGPTDAPSGISGVVQSTHRYADDGEFAVRLGVRDGDGADGADAFTITVRNVAPTVDAGPDRTAQIDAAVALSATFGDPGAGDTHTALIDWGDGTLEAGAVQSAVVQGVRTGVVTGTHAYSTRGSFTVTVHVTDDDGGEGADAFLVEVSGTAGDTPPTAADDTAEMDEDTPIAIALLANDTDPDGPLDPASLAITGQPLHGTLIVDPSTGIATYAPAADFHGTDGFRYTVADGGGLVSNEAVVSITVRAVNDAPVTMNDAFGLDEDQPTVVAPLANDADVDGDPLSLVVASQPLHGTLLDLGNGTLRYTPDADFNGTDAFTYRAFDGALTSGLATVFLAVHSVADAPVSVNDAFELDEDTTPALDVMANDRDADGDRLAIEIVEGPALGALTLRPDGLVDYAPRANANGADRFTYRLFDGALRSGEATVLITVRPVNDAPVAAGFSQTLLEGEVAVVDLRPHASDVDGDELAFVIDSGPAHGTLTKQAEGVYRYAPSANFFGADAIRWHATDGSTASNVVAVELSVQPANHAPVFTSVPITDFALPASAGAGGDAVFRVTGRAGESVAVRFEWQSREASYDNEVGIYRVDDLAGRVNGVPPGVDGYADAALGGGNAKVVFASGKTAGAAMTLTLRAGDLYAFYIVQDDSTKHFLARNPDNRIGCGPLAFFSVEGANPDRFDHLHATAQSDGSLKLAWEDLTRGGDRDFDDVVLRVTSLALPESSRYVYRAHAEDADGDRLAYSIVQSPAGATIDPATGELVWAPTAPGSYRFVLRADDGHGGVAEQTFDVNVHGGAARVLFVRGTEKGDDIEITERDGLVRVKVNGTIRTYTDIAAIHVESLNGGDRIELAGLTVDTFVDAGAGDDTIDAGCVFVGRLDLRGGAGDDHIQGGHAADRIDGGSGDDVLRGGDGADWIVGGEGWDRLYGEDGGDVLAGGAGDDRVNGGGGDDLLVRGPGADRLDGGPGHDRTIDFADFAAGRFTVPPGIAPAIDWNRIGALGAASEPTPRNLRQSSWVADFVGDLGRSAVERNPNSGIRIVVAPTGKGA